MNRILSAGIAGLLLALLAVAPASAATVTLRVEGATGTLAGPVVVDTSSVGTLRRNNANCAGTDSAAGALERAVAGDWDGVDKGFGVGVTRIRAEDYPTSLNAGSSDDSYWGLNVNGESANFGPCQGGTLKTGDEVVFAASCLNATTSCYQGGAIEATAPATARPGEATRVTAQQVSTTYGPAPDYTPITTRTAADRATVSGGGASATTGADGAAAITLTQRGAVTLRVTRQQQVPDVVSLCVTDGADGFCGTTAPDGTTLPPEIGGTVPAQEAVLGVSASAAPDRSAPKVGITGVKEGQRFSRKRAPRVLRAAVSDPSGVLQVKLALTRQVGKKCFWFSGSRERFVRSACGKRPRFKLPDTGDVSYLLPSRLKPGRYVFDVIATDRSYNRDELARGRNRVVFTVR